MPFFFDGGGLESDREGEGDGVFCSKMWEKLRKGEGEGENRSVKGQESKRERERIGRGEEKTRREKWRRRLSDLGYTQ